MDYHTDYNDNKKVTYHEQTDILNILKLRAVLKTLPDFCKDYFRAMDPLTTTKTRISYAYDIRIFFQFLLDENPAFKDSSMKDFTVDVLDQIRAIDIEEYQEYLKVYKNGEKTETNGERGLKRKISALRSFYAYYYKHEFIKTNPTVLIDVPKTHEKNIIRLDADEVAMLLDHIEHCGDELTGQKRVYYEKTKEQALQALAAYPQGLQIGGGICAENAEEFLRAGASHVIVTSYVFKDGQINYENLEKLKNTVGKEHLVLDLSCRKKDDIYYIVTDRWQKFTDVVLTKKVLDELAGSCSEFLIHAVDVEGKASGIERPLAKMLGEWEQIPVTYAGGVGSYEDLRILKELGQNHVNVTVGSALDLFGGQMEYRKVLELCRKS